MLIEPPTRPGRPLTYREHRKLREEAEKKRREYEEMLRKEERERREAEEKARAAAEEPEKPASKDEAEEVNDSPAVESSSVSKSSEVKSVKSTKSKDSRDPRDPRRKKLEEKCASKSSEQSSEEAKVAEPIKSFKIPKVKKVESQPKLAEIDIFKPNEVLNVTKPTHESSIDKSRKESDTESETRSRRSSASSQSHVDTDSDSEPSLTIAEQEEERVRRRSSASESQSDSETGKLARRLSVEKEKKVSSESQKGTKVTKARRRISSGSESSEESKGTKARRVSSTSDREETAVDREPSPVSFSLEDEDMKEEKNVKTDEDGAITKNELTKELLKTIVSSLDPKDATKLLEKAATLKKDDKISIETLKEFINKKEGVEEPDSEDEPLSRKRKRGRPKTPTKDKAVKKLKTKSEATKGIVEEEVGEQSKEPDEIPVEELLDDVEDETEEMNIKIETVETFVIEPKAVPKKGKKRGRKPKKDKLATAESESCGLQDDAISSSNIEDDIKGEVKDEPVETDSMDTEMIPLNVDEAPAMRRLSGNQEPSGMRQTRAMKSKMMKKTKTWKPSAEVIKLEDELNPFTSLKSPPLNASQIKSETVEADLKVFLGEGDVKADEFKDSKFEFSKGQYDANVKLEVKSRLNSVSSLFSKLMEQRPPIEKKMSSVEGERKPKKTLPVEEEKLCSKIKLCKPPTDSKGRVLAPPSLLSNIELPTLSLSSRISEVTMSLNVDESISPENDDTNQNSSFLDLIHNLNKRKKMPPALIPLNTDEVDIKSFNISEEDQDKFCREVSVPNPNAADYKTPEAYSQMLEPAKLRELFKCMEPSCSFTTSSAAEFGDHLDQSHGPDCLLRCPYCLGRVRTGQKLINHIIKHHGAASFQCIHSFFRAQDPVQLMVYQNIHFPQLPRGFIMCDHLQADKKYKIKVTSDVKFRCMGAGCSFECSSGDTELIEEHRWRHVKAEDLVGFSCPYSSFTSSDPVQILLHQTQISPGAVPMVHIKTIVPREESSEDEDNFSESNESDVDSELSDFDKDFYDDIEDAMDDVEKKDPLDDPLKRYLCSLCEFRDPSMNSLKAHVKTEHKLISFKFVPVNSAKTNHEKDSFIIVPKNNLQIQKTARSKSIKTIFSPTDIDSIPVKPDIYKYVLRCSLCDFGSRVRNNLVKHLRLHLKTRDNIPILAPVNPPTDAEAETSATSRMTSLLPDDIEEELKRKPISFEELELLPQMIPENLRFACCAKDCNYITIDEGMLLYHIKAFHKELRKYKCPHCPNVSIPFSEMELHLKCHGELLFKCGHCDYFHPFKRTAEAHAAQEHANKKYFVRNVREEEVKRREMGPDTEDKKEPVQPEVNKIIATYKPYRCGLCDFSSETVEEIRGHLYEVHSIHHQYKCGLCKFESDVRSDMEDHVGNQHPGGQASLVRTFYVDPTTVLDAYPDERRYPLWAREMEGLKHIRGILYDDMEDNAVLKQAVQLKKSRIKKLEEKEALERVDPDNSFEQTKSAKKEGKAARSELDFYPMSCKECGFSKKTVTGMKMHIKLNHLGVGKFQCRECVFSANLTNSIHGHYRNKHPEKVTTNDQGQEEFDYTEKVANAQNFSEDFWRDEWGIPTLTERKNSLNQDSDKKKRKSLNTDKDSPPLKKKPGAKRGRKKKTEIAAPEATKCPPTSASTIDDFGDNILKADREIDSGVTDMVKTSGTDTMAGVKPLEVSPFESIKTFMCSFCPKRSQNVDKIRRHLTEHHPDQEAEFHELSRDQAVAIITSDQYKGQGVNEYKCFYCQEVGSITSLYEHTETSHTSAKFRVVKFQGKGVTGYLECQVCGYLSPGFEKYLQKAHFHEEHPLENEVNCSKYMHKMKSGTEAFSSNQQAFKVSFKK